MANLILLPCSVLGLCNVHGQRPVGPAPIVAASSCRHPHAQRLIALRSSFDDDPNTEQPSISADPPPLAKRVRRPGLPRTSQRGPRKPPTPEADDEEPEPQGTDAAMGEDEEEVAPRSRPSRAGGRGAGRGKQNQKQRQRPTADELRAMGYDDVDDFEDAEYDKYQNEPLWLKEDHPLYVPALTDEALAEDPEDHRSGYVAVIGKPNAGKSCLINALVGQKLSIVCFKPQTTRHRIMGIASGREYQMVLFDTPGIIEKKRTKLEERMMMAVVGSIQDSEAIVAVVDAADRPKEALAMFQPGSNWTGPPMSVLLNKTDLVDRETLDELCTWYKENCRAEQVFLGSATQGDGIAAVKQWAVSKLPLGPTLYSKEVVSEQPQRFFVAELIREKIFFNYDQEIPYSVQVQIGEWRERPKPQKLFISAQIVVARESQVGIIIGRNGEALKRVGQQARKDIEEFLEQPVYLELGVQVSERWQESREALEKFGYFDPMLV